MFRTLSFPTICICLCYTTVSAQVTLEPKFQEGAKFTIQMESKATQTLTLAGMDIDTKSSTFLTIKKAIGKRAADGTLKVEEKTESIQSDISLPGGLSLQFDSANPDKKASIPQLEPILEVLRAVYRLPITVELDSKNKINNVSLPDGEFEQLSAAAKERLKPEAIKKSAEQAYAFLPDGPVKKGDTWERSTESNLGSGQVMSFRTKYEYVGTVEKDGKSFDKIVGKAFDVGFAINDNPALQVTKSDLKVIDSESTFLFDREEGTVFSRAGKTRIAGPLTLVINSMELPGKVDLTLEENASRQN